MKTVLFILLIINGLIMSGCGNSSQKQQEKAVIQQVNPLEKVFKDIMALDSIYHDNKEYMTWEQFNDSLRYFVYKDIIKEEISHNQSQRFFNKLCSLITRSIDDPAILFRVKYEDSVYKYLIYSGYMELREDIPTFELVYHPEYNQISCYLTENGRVVQSNGEVHYNTEGWHLDIDEYKDDFDEVVKKEAVAAYKIDGAEYSYSDNKLAVVMRTYAITLWTNELGELYKIKDIRIKDHKTGKIYNIDYDEPYLHGNRVMNDNIGVFMYGENAGKFIDIVSSLEDYTISIRGYYSDYEENVVIRNPENFNNIEDVYMQLLKNQENLSKSN